MFSEFKFIDFKSFPDTLLKATPFTLMIGANASGKSNAIDGIRVLSRISYPLEIGTILDGLGGQEPGIRGGSQGIPRKDAPDRSFVLACQIDDAQGSLHYNVQVDLEPRVIIYREFLEELDPRSGEWITLFETGDTTPERGDIQGNYYSGNRGRRPSMQFLRHLSALSQVPGRIPGEGPGPKRVRNAANRMAYALSQVLVLDPIPQMMRNYVPGHRTHMLSTGENLSAVVATLVRQPEKKARLLHYLQDLPEQRISDIDVISTPTGDVMLELHERPRVRMDARSLSDGTLRYLSIVAALLSAEPGATLVVEEIDNGLHPSRVGRLLAAIREAGVERGVQVIATTHNPALMNALTKEDLWGVVVCFREEETGASQFVPWLELPSYPSLMARARLGDLVARGDVDKALHADPEAETQKALDWIKENLP